jgi:hypothetical protein
MSAVGYSARELEAPPRWLRLWCFFLGCMVPIGGCAVSASDYVRRTLTDANLADLNPLIGLLLGLACCGFVMHRILLCGIGACFDYDAEAAKAVALMSAALGLLLVALLLLEDFRARFGLADWLYALTALYYLATTAILHARLRYLCRRLTT